MLAIKDKQEIKKGNIEIMRTYKGKGSTGWTGVDNKVINNNLMSVHARFILIFLLSKNESKDYIDQEIIAENCNLSVKQVSRYMIELKTFKHVDIQKSDKKNAKGQYTYKYRISEDSSILPSDINHRTYTSSGDKKSKTKLKPSCSNALSTDKISKPIGHDPQDIDVRLYNNTINNNTDNTKEKNQHQKDLSFEGNNVETSLINFADEVDRKEIVSKIQDLANQDLEISLSQIDNLCRKADLIRKLHPKNIVLDAINIFPDFAAANKNHNPKESYTDSQSFNFLSKLLISDCQYPKWFTNLQKSKVVEAQKEELKKEWKSFISSWGQMAVASNQSESLKLIVEFVLNYVKENELNPESKFIKRVSGLFQESIQKSLKFKSKSEIIDLIKSTSPDRIVPGIQSWYESGLSFDILEKYIGV